MDHASELALAGAGLTGEQHMHVERCHQSSFLEDGRQGRTATDDAGELQRRPQRRGGIARSASAVLEQHPVDQRRQVAGEDLRSGALVF
jgi:hypothetical protein